MSIFGKIRDAIFGHPKAKPAPQPAPAPAAPAAAKPAAPAAAPTPAPAAAPAQPVDVEAVLKAIEEQKGHPKLDWHHSIVDLMKLLDLDSSLDNRKELATELGYSGEKNGSAEMNLWLHKAVMTALEKNGGKVPAGMKD